MNDGTGALAPAETPRPLRSECARTLRGIAVAALLLGAGYVLADVLLLVFAATLLACVLLAASRFVARYTGISRRVALGLLLAAALAAVALLLWQGAAGIMAQASTLAEQLQQRLSDLQAALSRTPWGASILQRVQGYMGEQHFAGMAGGIATSTLGLLGTLVVLVATGIYMALSPQLYRDGTMRLLPLPWRPRGYEVLDALASTLSWWFLGQLVDMVVIGSLTFAGLEALGVPLAGMLALIAALLNFVPYVGAICGAVPAVLVALGQGGGLALETGLLFVAVQGLEGNVVAPLVQRRTVALPPMLTILSQTVFGTLFGIGGLVLATPIAAALMVLVRMVYVEDVLGDRAPADQR